MVMACTVAFIQAIGILMQAGRDRSCKNYRQRIPDVDWQCSVLLHAMLTGSTLCFAGLTTQPLS